MNTTANSIGVIIVAAIFIVGIVYFNDANAQDVIACTNGTIVIHIRTPGMCPPGFYPL